ncbi:hypothetical protein ACFOUO_13700 [Salinithrix halophila]|uniref:Uncharacterized protein n=1 Tax=Salinithrix halophila TaxID=1485204 RepID=A0ABV8JFW6_9BACL
MDSANDQNSGEVILTVSGTSVLTLVNDNSSTPLGLLTTAGGINPAISAAVTVVKLG